MKENVINEIIDFVAREKLKIWKTPLVGFADVQHPYIRDLRSVVHKEHQMPEEVLPGASIIVVYFVPFEDSIPVSNKSEGLSSPDWAQAYEETNAMFVRLNKHMVDYIRDQGFKAEVASEASVFYRDEVISHWSFRHIAYAAGLGTFGLNNMLITENGCAGRFNCIVTNLDVEPGSPQAEEACLYKRKGVCGLCVKKCPIGALSVDGFDRHKCFGQCLVNAETYTTFGSSYASNPGEEAEDSGSEVCGKCLSGMPCTLKKPK